ncbi:proline iminopeptidase [Chitinophaga niastensis]|uniref:Proline iminopeptidase n=1 Tax=Chitinophaga niastensis TaxID=536980 RepID=A0A2P8HP96_CHINA|nr:alpha/beta hydrolase [Chitinophaga niastensis]PSL48039.1 proline iminopeptidase [Chitinophaga niastensis]
MKQIVGLVVLLLTTFFTSGQTLYTKAYGSSKNKPVIFIHGGPGSSSVAFEATTAQKLADNGFYVILYDRRGEGLSKDENAKFNFQETFDDLNGIYKKFGIKKATLIGFSFGGIVSTLYTEKYADNVTSLILVSSLLSQQETYSTILKRSKVIYQTQKDSANLNNIFKVENMDKSSFEYRASCFKHASQNGFFATKNQNDLAKSLYSKLQSDSGYMKFSSQKNNDAVVGFWKNEKYSTMSIMPVLKHLQSEKIKIYALYGKDDGIFSTEQVMNLQDLIGNDKLKYLDNCAHYLYTDQQIAFIAALKTWIK